MATKPLAGGLNHRGGAVQRDHVPARQALKQEFRDATRAAARIHDRLVTAQLKPIEHDLSPLQLGCANAVVGLAVPAALGHVAMARCQISRRPSSVKPGSTRVIVVQ